MAVSTASFWQMVYGSESVLPTPSLYGSEVFVALPVQSHVALSLNRPNDEYDDLGRNVSAQKRRQNAEPWVQVSYIRHRCHHEENDLQYEE